METQDRNFEEACVKLHREFFAKHSNEAFRDLVSQALAMLLTKQKDFPGEANTWAGGIVHAVGSGGFGVPDVSNAQMEAAFGAKMSVIRTRAAKIKQLLGDDAPLYIPGLTSLSESIQQESGPQEFTLRDEANAICAYAFRNGPIEDIHADGRISDDEMKRLMINACESMGKLLTMKHATPEEYDAFIRDYGRKFCGRWQR